MLADRHTNLSMNRQRDKQKDRHDIQYISKSNLEKAKSPFSIDLSLSRLIEFDFCGAANQRQPMSRNSRNRDAVKVKPRRLSRKERERNEMRWYYGSEQPDNINIPVLIIHCPTSEVANE